MNSRKEPYFIRTGNSAQPLAMSADRPGVSTPIVDGLARGGRSGNTPPVERLASVQS